MSMVASGAYKPIKKHCPGKVVLLVQVYEQRAMFYWRMFMYRRSCPSGASPCTDTAQKEVFHWWEFCGKDFTCARAMIADGAIPEVWHRLVASPQIIPFIHLRPQAHNNQT